MNEPRNLVEMFGDSQIEQSDKTTGALKEHEQHGCLKFIFIVSKELHEARLALPKG